MPQRIKIKYQGPEKRKKQTKPLKAEVAGVKTSLYQRQTESGQVLSPNTRKKHGYIEDRRGQVVDRRLSNRRRRQPERVKVEEGYIVGVPKAQYEKLNPKPPLVSGPGYVGQVFFKERRRKGSTGVASPGRRIKRNQKGRRANDKPVRKILLEEMMQRTKETGKIIDRDRKIIELTNSEVKSLNRPRPKLLEIDKRKQIFIDRRKRKGTILDRKSIKQFRK